MSATFVNPFRRNNRKTVKNNRNNTLDRYIIDNEDDLLDEDKIQKYTRSYDGKRNNAVRRVLKELISRHRLNDTSVENKLLNLIIKKNSGLTTNQKVKFLDYRYEPNEITNIVRNINKSRVNKNHYLSNNNNVTRRNNNGYHSNASNPR
jgi:hypothetical protein